MSEVHGEVHGEAERYGPVFDPTRTVVLAASAGTGKTWRLVRRYLRIVAGAGPQAGAPWARPEQVVAVTFTRAAAAEMRARLFAALTSKLGQVDGGSDPILAELLGQRSLSWRLALAEQIAPAPIGTLHSLCARLLAEFPELSGVPPDARPLEPAEQELELDEFVSAWLERVIDEPAHAAHGLCLELLGAHPLAFIRRELRVMIDDRDWTLAELVGGAQQRAASSSTPTTPGASSLVAPALDWRRPASVAAAREAFVRMQWRQYMHYIQQPLALLLQACALSFAQGHASDRLAELKKLSAQMLRHVPEPDLERVGDDLDALLELRPSKKLGAAEPALQNLRNSHKVLSTRRRRPVMPNPRASSSVAQAEHIARWVNLASHARADWLASLRERAVLRYDDLERLTYELLDDPRAQQHLRGRYRHVLVDEYQDVNPIQAEIIDRLAALAGGEQAAKLFLVGDPKQSIYRFRGADPRVFRRAEVVHTEDGAPGVLVRLAENRRSAPSLVRFLAHLFPPLFSGSLPWANITELGRPQELARLRDVEDYAPVPWDGPIVTVRERDRLSGLAVDLLMRHRLEPSPHEQLGEEAERVALHLRGMLAGATLGPDDPRLCARELAILVPRWHMAEHYRAALERQGIAADLAGGRGLLLLPEVRDLINLVRLWADEQDEQAALAVLRGPCFAISDLGLYLLARWAGVDRRVREADPDLPDFAELDEVWEPWDDEGEEAGEDQGADADADADTDAGVQDAEQGGASWPRRGPRRVRELLRHGRLDPARAVAALERAQVIRPREAESPAQARARLLTQLEADAAALEHGRDSFLARMREAGARLTAELLADLIVEFDLEAHWLASPRGRRAVANAWRFVDHVRSLEPEGPDLLRLTTWLDAGAEPASEGLIAPDADAVTITTWHGSKGKEWPVVVVAGIGEFRSSGSQTSWSATQLPSLDGLAQEQLAVPRIRAPHVGFVATEDPLHQACTNMLAPLEAAEAKRLIYVAMTRARDRLVLSGEADLRAHVYYDDKPWLGLDRGVDMKPLLGEPKPAFLCRRPVELIIAGLDLPASPTGTGIIRPRAATWSLAHLRVIDDEMLLAGGERELPAAARAPTPRSLIAAFEALAPEPAPPPPAPTPAPAPVPAPAAAASPARPKPARPRKPRRKQAKPGQPEQLGFAAFFDPPQPEPRVEPEPEPEPVPEPPALTPAPKREPGSGEPWQAGASMQLWTPSGGRSPWPVSELEWEMPLPARRPALLDEEDPRLLGELFHRAMELWDFVGAPPASEAFASLTALVYPTRVTSERRELSRWVARCCELFATDAELLAQLRAARQRGELFHEVDLGAIVAESERDHWISGRIDLLWRGPDGRWNVLDYKVTGKVRSRALMEELQWEYGPQLLLYRKALAAWRLRGEAQQLGRLGLWLAPAGKAMWLADC